MFEIPTAQNLVDTFLLPDERLICQSYQVRLLALAHRRQGVFATDQRLIVIMPDLISGCRVKFIAWQDLHSIDISCKLISASICLTIYSRHYTYFMGPPDISIVLAGFEKSTLAEVNAICWNKVQYWREQNRSKQLIENISKSYNQNIRNFV